MKKALVVGLLLASIFTIAAVLAEPWNTILFLVAIPLTQQLIKLVREHTGVTIGKLGNQIVSLVLTMTFFTLNGGFLGLSWPDLPVFADDIVVFTSDVIQFAGDTMLIVGSVWGSMVALYEVVWDRLFVKFGLATADKL